MGYVKFAANDCLLATSIQTSWRGGMVNFTNAACGSTSNVAWTIGFGAKNGNLTNICGTLPTTTDFYLSIVGESGQTATGSIYYSSAPAFLTGIPYHYESGITHLTAPSTGYAAALDFDVGSLAQGVSIFEMDNCYLTSAPSYNPNLLQLTFTPTVAAGQSCNVAITSASLGSPYYVQIGANVLPQNSGWSWTGKNILVNSTASGTTYLVSWAPLSSGSGPGGGGQVVTTTTTNTFSGPATTTPANGTPTTTVQPQPIPPSGTVLLLALLFGIVITFTASTETYKREKQGAGFPYLTALIVGGGTYLLADLLGFSLGFAQTIDARLGMPVFLDLSAVAAPIVAWLDSLGNLSVPFLAVMLGTVAVLPYLIPYIAEKLDEVS